MTESIERKFSDDEKLELLADLISFRTVNNNEFSVAKYIQNKLAQYKIDSKILPVSENRANIIAELGKGKPIIGISGHMDVVSEIDASKWQSDPFTMTEKNGNLYGRGTADMKSGLAAMIITLIELKQRVLPKNGTIRFMATVGEEIGGIGANKLHKYGYTRDIDALIIGEPSNHEIIYAHKGSMDIRLTSYGEVAHSSIPESGFNALNPIILILAEAKKIFDSVTVSNETLGDLKYNATILHSGDQVNSTPDKAFAEMNVRTIPEYSSEKVEKVFQKLVEEQNKQGAKVKMDIYMVEEPVLKSSRNRLIELATSEAKRTLGIEYKTTASVGVTDASNLLKDHLNVDFPFIMFGPGDYRVAHKINEYVNKKEYLCFSNIYSNLLIKYLEPRTD